jgi:ABC-type lipoprotein release transport system permease subunit
VNPLSARTFYSRHKRHVAMLLSLSIVVTLGLYSIVALVWGVFVEPGRLAYMAYSKFSLVTPQSTKNGPDPAVLARLASNPDITKIIPSTFIRIELPGMVPGQGFQFDLLGLMKKDDAYFLESFAATVKTGRMPHPGAAELVLSEDVANMLNVEVGDSYVVTSLEFYAGMDAIPEPTTFEVVGILDSDIELGIVSLEFLNHNEQYRQLPARFLVVAREGREAAVDDFLRSQILSRETGVMTHQMLSERIRNEALPGLVMLLPVVLIAAVAFSLVIVVVNQLANAQRLPEFGILHAIGRSRKWLIRRLTVETTTLALVGWAIGIGLSYLSLHLLKVTVFAARGHDLNYVAWLPLVFSLPAPAAIAGFTFLTVRRTLTRLDPVAIVERRELSAETPFRTEADQRRPRTAAASSRASLSSPRPLGPATFYRQHRRRAVLLIGAMGLMITAVILFIFALAVNADAKEPFLGYLRQISVVRSPGIVQSLDPGVVARVEAHPAVERVIRIAPRYSMLNVAIPPFASAEASPFGVYAEDMAYLVELYGLESKEGHLPQPGTNEMVVSEALAQNRDLEVGDVIGDPERPAYPGAPSLNTEFRISGIFARPTAPENGIGLGFVSLEFLESLEPYGVPEVPPLIVVPKAGQKDVLDDWLENQLAGVNASVLTYHQEISRIQNQARQDMLSIALLEGFIALVAAIGLAVLNYVFISQRQAEFAVLHALGYSRRQLVWRVLGETAFTTGIAWGLTAILCLAAILGLRFGVFAPLGLTFDLFNFTPWFYTLPIPMAVLAVTAGTTARTLAKLDAVSIIERRG